MKEQTKKPNTSERLKKTREQIFEGFFSFPKLKKEKRLTIHPPENLEEIILKNGELYCPVHITITAEIKKGEKTFAIFFQYLLNKQNQNLERAFVHWLGTHGKAPTEEPAEELTKKEWTEIEETIFAAFDKRKKELLNQ